jgi:hypothetical protein
MTMLKFRLRIVLLSTALTVFFALRLLDGFWDALCFYCAVGRGWGGGQ